MNLDMAYEQFIDPTLYKAKIWLRREDVLQEFVVELKLCVKYICECRQISCRTEIYISLALSRCTCKI